MISSSLFSVAPSQYGVGTTNPFWKQTKQPQIPSEASELARREVAAFVVHDRAGVDVLATQYFWVRVLVEFSDHVTIFVRHG
jgi:hypothetical protein